MLRLGVEVVRGADRLHRLIDGPSSLESPGLESHA
jgi:hypothetical protein